MTKTQVKNLKVDTDISGGKIRLDFSKLTNHSRLKISGNVSRYFNGYPDIVEDLYVLVGVQMQTKKHKSFITCKNSVRLSSNWKLCLFFVTSALDSYLQ